MKEKSKMIMLPCDCKCCMLAIEKTVWEDNDVSYDISIQDSRYDHNYNTVWGRIKRAVKILLGKPIYYSDLHLDENHMLIMEIAYHPEKSLTGNNHTPVLHYHIYDKRFCQNKTGPFGRTPAKILTREMKEKYGKFFKGIKLDD